MPGQHVAIVVFGFDYNAYRNGIGHGTRQRLLEGIRLYKEFKKTGNYPLMIFSPGRAPGVSARDQEQTMAQMMRLSSMAQGIESADILLPQSETIWGTREEVLEAVRTICRLRSYGYAFERAYMVSNRLHLLRIQALADALKRRFKLPWQWHHQPCPWSLSSWNWRERLKEFSKLLVELGWARQWHPQL